MKIITRKFSEEEIIATARYWNSISLDDAIPMEFPFSELDESKNLNNDLLISKSDNKDVRLKDQEIRNEVGRYPTSMRTPQFSAPWWNCGKLLYTKDLTDRSYHIYCTASFVGSPHTLMTNAHCVFDHNLDLFNGNFCFFRANSQKVFIKEICIYEDFYSPRFNARWDYAFMKTVNASGAGYLGFKYPEESMEVVSIGYPSCLGGNPKTKCFGGTEITDQNMYFVSGEIQIMPDLINVMTNNPMQHGSSGGPWISDFSVKGGSGKNNVSGINSFSRTDNEMNGPAFDEHTLFLLNHVMGIQ